MGEIHQLIRDEGIEVARRFAATKQERVIVEAAAAFLADESGDMGIAHAGFALTALPHKDPKGSDEPEYHRKANGRCTLIVQSGRRADGSLVGVPYGAKARMILLYYQTQAVRTNCRKVELGGNWHAWMRAVNLKLWPGTTRSSVSAVVTRVAGYFVPGFKLWYGEYLYRAGNSSALSDDP